MLSVPRNAPADEIKKAFRREIARYHPDKVQHLGKEFQEMASGIAADLTEAYRILMDPALRQKYDEDLSGGQPGTPVPPPRPPAADPVPPPRTPGPESSSTSWSASAAPPPGAASRHAQSAGTDFVKKASLSKLRAVIDEVLVNATPLLAPGFDIALVTKPKKGLFKKAEESVCLLVKYVPQVDPESIVTLWPAASRAKAPGAEACVLMLVGPGMAPAKELAAAISDQRRKARGGGPVLIPVDVRDWEALFPPDAPGTVRAVIQRLKDEKR
jgi:hypothetical protein